MTNSRISEKSTELRFSLQNVVYQEVEDFVHYWGEKSTLKGKTLYDLIYAVNETVKTIVTLAKDLNITGELEVETLPYTQWLTVKLTFPKDVPLHPPFERAAEGLQESPERTFTLQTLVMMQHVDKAIWEQKGKKISILLTQYMRREGHPGELYFLGLTPSPVKDLHLRFLSEGFAIALSPHIKSAFRLTKEAAFVLQAIDGKTSLREIYRAFIEEFGLVNPRAIGGIIEDFILKGLIIPGHPLVEVKTGIWGNIKKVAEKVFAFQYSLPNPDAFVDSLNRWAGWLWSAPAAWIYAGFVAFSLWFFHFDLVPDGHIFVHLYNTPALLNPWALLGLFWGFTVTVAIHEISHAMACKRLGGNIWAFGIMLYYGALAAYCDTSDAWKFPNKWHRIAVSLAGPFSTLIMGCLFGWANYFLARFGHPTLGVFFGALAFLSMLCVVFNLIPFLELDGYYMGADFFEIPNLKKKSLGYLAALGKKVLGKGELPSLPARDFPPRTGEGSIINLRVRLSAFRPFYNYSSHI
jgi:putative peptide zinc metalloprotease protein